jgi:hypothetical protein
MDIMEYGWAIPGIGGADMVIVRLVQLSPGGGTPGMAIPIRGGTEIIGGAVTRLGPLPSSVLTSSLLVIPKRIQPIFLFFHERKNILNDF